MYARRLWYSTSGYGARSWADSISKPASDQLVLDLCWVEEAEVEHDRHVPPLVPTDNLVADVERECHRTAGVEHARHLLEGGGQLVVVEMDDRVERDQARPVSRPLKGGRACRRQRP